MTEKRDYRDTVFLPKTEFPMKAGLPQKEPGIAARWEAERLYEQFVTTVRGRGVTVATGRFRAMMRVALVNDGPVTLLIDSTKLF